MSVVLRCPNCGTTQTTPGDCEACHEAQVRYFCTNHEPGIWLDGPTCPQCAARPAPAPRPPRPRPAVVASRIAREPLPPMDEERLDLRPAGQAFWEKLLRSAVVARRPPPPEDVRVQRGWFVQLLLRLTFIGVVLIVGILVALYWAAQSLG
ncbi:MAG: hypothetical protein ABI678_01265 [Kofleriaceae bacterium]